MTREQVIDSQIEEVMDEFDFAKVHEYMKAANWTWSTAEDCVPTIQELRRYVRGQMRIMAKSGHVSQISGGFLITFHDSKKWLRFDVCFVIESWHMDGVCYEKEKSA